MRRHAFILTILFLLILLIIANNISPKTLSSSSELSKHPPNQKLIVQGKILKEIHAPHYKLLTLQLPATNEEVLLKCPLSCPPLLNKNISAITSLEYYNKKHYLKILEINTLQ